MGCRLHRKIEEYWYADENAADAGPGNEVRLITSTYDLAGRMLSSSDPDHDDTYAFDALDRVTFTEHRITGLVPSAEFFSQYDLAGNRRTLAASEVDPNNWTA